MDAKELRIGNYIHSVVTSCNFKRGLVEVDFNTFAKIRLQNALPSLEPIPLTEEWLLKFGFEKNYVMSDNHSNEYDINKTDRLDLNNKYLRVRTDNKFFSVFNHSNCNYDKVQFITGIKHVHQLQNLFFCLVGKELTIKEN